MWWSGFGNSGRARGTISVSPAGKDGPGRRALNAIATSRRTVAPNDPLGAMKLPSRTAPIRASHATNHKLNALKTVPRSAHASERDRA
jgi:hypothetical protein